MKKLRILFVDDEANVLSGLRRLFRNMRDEWDMEFAASGEEAIKLIDAEPFDVVVSDMMMPVMSGAELLKRIKKYQAPTVRIILSGHSDPKLTMKAVGPTHQFLAKPCDPDQLKETIRRVSALRDLLLSDSLRRFVSGIESLPSVPQVYTEIMECLEDPESTLDQVAEIVEKDMGMTAKLLHLSNSAFYGIGRPVLTVKDAVSFLGIDTISTLVLGSSAFAQFEQHDCEVLDISNLWDYSLRTAAIAVKIAKMEGMDSRLCYEARMAAMLHDIGKLVLAIGKPELLRKCAPTEDAPYGLNDAAIVEELGTGISGIGAYLLGLWGLPERVVEAVAYHDRPGESESSQFDVLGVVHVASRLAANSETDDPGDPQLYVDTRYLQNTGVSDRWADWKAVAFELSHTEELPA